MTDTSATYDSPPDGTRPRVLIVDDEPVVLDLLREVLAHCEIRTAVDAASAIREVERSAEIDVALVDKNLPDGNGLDVIADIRARAPGAEAILITAYPSLESAIDSVGLRAFDYLIKPFRDINEVVVKVRNAFDKSRLRAERHRLFEALRESEERYREVFNASSDAILLLDCETRRVRDANAAAERLYGYARPRLIGMRSADLVAHAGVGRAAAEQVPGEPRIAVVDRRDLRQDGVEIPVEVATGFTTIQGHGLVIEAVRDVSERMTAEQRRLQLEEQLRQAQKLEALGQLAGGVSHDFNNLLTVMRSYASFINAAMERLPDGSGAEQARDDAQSIVEACDSAAQLTRQLLAFSRKQLLVPEVLVVNEVVERFAKLLRRTLGENIHLVTELSPDLWTVKIDRGQLEQILANLAVNARDAMPQGGTLTIRTRNQERVDGGRRAVLEVTDTGCGMPPEVAANAFEPFFTTKGGERGAGLGLATVRGIVEQAEGTIAFDSKQDQGTTFRIELPTAQGESRGWSPDPVGVLRPGRGERILVVEDDDIVRKVTHRILAQAGYSVLDASTGAEAMDVMRLREGTIDLLLADVRLPDTSGPELARRIFDDDPEASILLMSAWAVEVTHPDGARGVGAFLPKPFTPEDLLRCVRDALDQGIRIRPKGRGKDAAA